MLKVQDKHHKLGYNYAYFPVLFESEEKAVRIASALKENGILARKYFYPSLESVACLDAQAEQPVSNDIASRILCLPIFDRLRKEDIAGIIEMIGERL